MKILYLTQWFEPEPAFKGLDFARALANRGHIVEVVTAFPNYPGGKIYPGYRLRPYKREASDEITLHRLFVWPSHDRSSIGRMLNYVSFWFSALVFGLLRGNRYDAVYVYHPPLTPALAAALFCAVWRKPYLVEIQDLWPDSVASSGMAGRRVVAVLDRLCRFVYRRATKIIVQSDGMMARLVERNVDANKLERIYNWSTYTPAAGPEECAPHAIVAAFTGRINIIYGGNLGQAQALDTVIDAIGIAIAHHPNLHLHLFGAGIQHAALTAHVAETELGGYVTFHGPVGRQAMDRIFDLADLLVLHLKADPLYEVTIPSKTQHYLSCGKPIVAGLSGEAASLLQASGGALVCDPEDAESMAAALSVLAKLTPHERAILGENGRKYYQKNLSFTPAIDRTIAAIEKAVFDFGAEYAR